MIGRSRDSQLLAVALRLGSETNAQARVLMEERMRTVVRVLAQGLAITLLMTLAFGTSLGHAQATPANKARARELYTQGQQQFRQGDFTTAQRSFEDAYRAVPNPVVLLSISECQVRTEEFVAAVATLRRYLTEKPGAPDRAQVEGQIAALEAKPGSVSIDSSPPGAVIWIDGENTGYLTPNEISVRAGQHTVSVTAQDYQTSEQPIEVVIGSRQRVSLTLTPVQPVVAQDTAVTSTPVEESSPRGPRHMTPAVWGTMALAVAGGLTGTALGVTALHKVKQYKAHPTAKLKDQGNKMALFADVNFGVAIVAGVTGLVLYLTSGHTEERPKEQAFSITPEISPNELGLSGHMRF